MISDHRFVQNLSGKDVVGTAVNESILASILKYCSTIAPATGLGMLLKASHASPYLACLDLQ